MMFPPAYGREIPIIFAAVLSGQLRALCYELGRSGCREVCGTRSVGLQGFQMFTAVGDSANLGRIMGMHVSSSFLIAELPRSFPRDWVAAVCRVEIPAKKVAGQAEACPHTTAI